VPLKVKPFLESSHIPNWVAITFYEGAAYVVDSSNRLVLKIKPGETDGEIFFGGKGKGRHGPGQCKSPTSITVSCDKAYISHHWGVIETGDMQGQGLQFEKAINLSQSMQACQQVAKVDLGNGVAAKTTLFIAQDDNGRILIDG